MLHRQGLFAPVEIAVAKGAGKIPSIRQRKIDRFIDEPHPRRLSTGSHRVVLIRADTIQAVANVPNHPIPPMERMKE